MPSAIALLTDLMFMVKVQDAAKSVGLPIKFMKTTADIEQAAHTNPSLILFDLNLGGPDVLTLITALKADPATRDIHLVGFISHVQVEARAAAVAAGCDLVVARSVFSQQLPAILRQYGLGQPGS